MGRRFTAASSERIQIGSAGLNGFNFNFGTFAVCGYLISHTTYGSYFAVNGGTSEISVTDTGGVLAWFDGISEARGITAVTLNESMVLVWTKATGAVLPVGHLYKFSTGVWVHESLNTGSPSVADAATTTAVTIGSYQDAGSTDPLDAEVWAIAAWPSLVMSDQQVERLARGGWASTEPTLHEEWVHGREVGDMGTTIGRIPVRQTARTGTTRGAQPPPPGFGFSISRRRR